MIATLCYDYTNYHPFYGRCQRKITIDHNIFVEYNTFYRVEV